MTLPPAQDPGSSLAIAVLGLGEAGSLIARDLIAAGAAVRGYDPKAASGEVTVPDGVVVADSEAGAVAGSALVLSVNSAKVAVPGFEAAIPAPRPGHIWADLNAASPGAKEQLAAIGQRHGIPVTDIAMMAPVPGKGLKVPMLASGAAAGTVAARLARLGANVEVLDGPAGLAADRARAQWPSQPGL